MVGDFESLEWEPVMMSDEAGDMEPAGDEKAAEDEDEGDAAEGEALVGNAAAVVVKEADGFKLHLSSRSTTGYLGVRPCGDVFQARRQSCAPAKRVSLGTFDTAVEAAVAYAKRMAADAAEGEEGEQVDGYKLLHSRNSTTGFLGVSRQNDRFRAEINRSHGRISLGRFDTAVEAAVAVAKHVMAVGGEGEVEEVEEAEEVVMGADGFKLHLSRKSCTGYRGVYPQNGRFVAKYQSGGKRIQIGTFDTAEEAAVAYAEHAIAVGGAEEKENSQEEEETANDELAVMDGAGSFDGLFAAGRKASGWRYGMEVLGMHVSVRWAGNAWYAGKVTAAAAQLLEFQHLLLLLL